MGLFLSILIFVPVMFFSLSIHEFAHGWIASVLGDDTAKSKGRLSLNPLVHIDPFGTLLLPLTLLLIHSPFVFGWAKPVPVDPSYFRNPKRDMLWVALAGPISNFLLAFVGGLFIRFISIFDTFPTNEHFMPIYLLLGILVIVNLLFSAFNLIPILPLDGARILVGILPRNIAWKYARLERYGILLLMLLFLLGKPLLTVLIYPFVSFFGLLFAGFDIWILLENILEI